ncbi:MAG TPA: hypothetical protein VKD90_17020 [Gemmataceae bacterium]|nr:hypothetical protein [Gemmataceae bacterium]
MPGTLEGKTVARVNDVGIDHIVSGDCINVETDITVTYTNVNLASGAVVLTCCAAAVITPASCPAPAPGGTCTFHVVHPSGGMGHTLTATLQDGGVGVATDSVSPVNVGDPCPAAAERTVGRMHGVLVVDLSKALSGTFDATVGNRIILLVEAPPQVVNGTRQQPVLVFADPADAKVAPGAKQGTWSHAAIPGARKGYYLRVVLTKDGVVKSTVRYLVK